MTHEDYLEYERQKAHVEDHEAFLAEEQYFRWAYVLLVELAKEELRKANGSRERPNDWPAGQEWCDLAATSQSIFLRKARDRAGIDHDQFLEPIRSGRYDVEDLVQAT